jgi:hypoxanthine phosphoribosyltransferase
MSINIVNITLKDLPTLADQLAGQIRSNGFPVGHILYIERAGRLPGYLLQSRLGGSISGVRTERPRNLLKELLSPLIPFIPLGIRDKLRKGELRAYQRLSKRKVEFKEELPHSQTHLLVIDDSIDSGYSVQAVLKTLLEKGFARNRIKIGAINTTLQSHAVDPDFLCFENQIISFPWSRDSMERKTYLQLYRNCPQSLKEPGLLTY